MTQTRPANPYAESPRDEGESQALSSEFQQSFEPTQVDSPTESHRQLPISIFDDPIELEATQVEETQIDSQAAAPSAQPHQSNRVPNAFEILQQAQKMNVEVVKTKKRQLPNQFINDQADLSDEEVMGMGMGGSGDEDETLEDLDAELTEMVDNEKVDADLEAEQNDLVHQQVL